MTSPRSFPEDWSVASGINCSVNDELEAKLPLSDTFDPRFGDDALLHWPPLSRQSGKNKVFILQFKDSLDFRSKVKIIHKILANDSFDDL
jgi:hypothetical protein